jgi:hypothetical protein
MRIVCTALLAASFLFVSQQNSFADGKSGGVVAGSQSPRKGAFKRFFAGKKYHNFATNDFRAASRLFRAGAPQNAGIKPLAIGKGIYRVGTGLTKAPVQAVRNVITNVRVNTVNGVRNRYRATKRYFKTLGKVLRPRNMEQIANMLEGKAQPEAAQPEAAQSAKPAKSAKKTKIRPENQPENKAERGGYKGTVRKSQNLVSKALNQAINAGGKLNSKQLKRFVTRMEGKFKGLRMDSSETWQRADSDARKTLKKAGYEIGALLPEGPDGTVSFVVGGDGNLVQYLDYNPQTGNFQLASEPANGGDPLAADGYKDQAAPSKSEAKPTAPKAKAGSLLKRASKGEKLKPAEKKRLGKAIQTKSFGNKNKQIQQLAKEVNAKAKSRVDQRLLQQPTTGNAASVLAEKNLHYGSNVGGGVIAGGWGQKVLILKANDKGKLKLEVTDVANLPSN